MKIPKSRQEYYDMIVEALKTEMFPAVNKLGVCIYRKDKKPTSIVRCVGGMLVPDKEYVSRLDSRGSLISIKNDPDLLPCFHIPEGMSLDDVIGLQALHDNNVTNGMNENDRKVYKKYFLTRMNRMKWCKDLRRQPLKYIQTKERIGK